MNLIQFQKKFKNIQNELKINKIIFKKNQNFFKEKNNKIQRESQKLFKFNKPFYISQKRLQLNNKAQKEKGDIYLKVNYKGKKEIMGAIESTDQANKTESATDNDNLEVLNTSQMDLIDKTADFIKSSENENYGRFKVMQYRISKRQFAIVERISSEFKDFEKFCREVDKRLRFDAPQLVKWIKAYKSCEKQLCSQFFKVFISIEYIPYTLNDQLQSRKKRQTHCGEKEIFNMIDSVVSALIYLNSQGIYHRYIQPKTVLYDQVNRTYKITDIQFLNGGVSEYQQFIYGVHSSSSCYLSPQLLKSLNHRQLIPEHSQSKSDIFSLGLCALEMATMKSIQNIYDFQDFKIFEDQLNQHLQEVQTIYSEHLFELLSEMLRIPEIQRPDFDDLAHILQELSSRPQFIESTQSLRASVISEELGKSIPYNKKSGLERNASCNLLRSKHNNSISQSSNILNQHNQSNHNKSQNSNLNRVPSQPMLKKNQNKNSKGLGESEEENQKSTSNSQVGDQHNQNKPYIRVLDPILTNEKEEIFSPVVNSSNQQLKEASSFNLASMKSLKMTSIQNFEDFQIQQPDSFKNLKNIQQTNSPQKISPQKDKKEYFNQIEQALKQQQQSISFHENSQNQNILITPIMDPIEQEYEDFKNKQKKLQNSQKKQVNYNDKSDWVVQQQKFIQDSKKHEQMQQSYLQSQQQGNPNQYDGSRKQLTSQKNLNNGAKEIQNFLQNYNKQNQLSQITMSPVRSTFSTIKSPEGTYYGRPASQTLYIPSGNRIESQNNRQIPISGRNTQFRSQYQLNKSPKQNISSRQLLYNDENENLQDSRYTGRSQVQFNIENSVYNEYNSNNFNNSKFENSIGGSKADMSMLSNYELKDIHIKPLLKSNSNIQNTLKILEQRIDKIDQSLTNIKRPQRSSSNHEFAFNQNNKINSSYNNNKPQSFQSQLKQQQQMNGGQSAKVNFFNQNYSNNIPYSTSFSSGNQFDNAQKYRF